MSLGVIAIYVTTEVAVDTPKEEVIIYEKVKFVNVRIKK